MVIKQDGIDYFTKIVGPTFVIPGNSGWVTISGAGLTSIAFNLYDPTTGLTNTADHPNFDGDTITFGYLASGGQLAGDDYSTDYDNLVIDIDTTPLPGALPLFASGLGALGLLARRRKKKIAVATAAI